VALRESSHFRIPLRVWRPFVTSETLRLLPLMQTPRTNAARIERVPCVSAGAVPDVLLAGHPPTPGTPDARTGGAGPLLVHSGSHFGQCRRQTEDDIPEIQSHEPYYRLGDPGAPAETRRSQRTAGHRGKPQGASCRTRNIEAKNGGKRPTRVCGRGEPKLSTTHERARRADLSKAIQRTNRSAPPILECRGANP